ncbi:MAG: MFS transporter DHA1 family bicyclomycin/chloramphenicol resistance protein [Puniceicoccaceae bacterium 5H]|nr:MAG: MFS transporter DHA1 family bicyclomycin/chloramphenicol resistance protein [Puniceicoccaceae bacterium 5H]
MLLASAVALGPFSTDAYLPAFPSMAEYFGVTTSSIAGTMSVYLVGIATGQLVGGYLSDRFRRKHVLLCGLILFIASSLGIIFQPALIGIYILRFFQAVGGGVSTVCVPALVRDRVSGKEAAKLFSMIGLIMIAAPAIAPSLGSLILSFSDWRGIFVFLVFYALFVAVAMMLGLKPAKHHLPTTGPLGLRESFLLVLRNPVAMRFVGVQSLGFSVILIFVTNASLLYQEHFHVSNGLFSILFAANIAMMMTAMFTSRTLVERIASVTIMRRAVILQTAALVVLIPLFLAYPHLGIVVPCMMLSVGALGAISPNAQACFLEFFPNNSGVAASIMGTMQFFVASVISAFSAWVGHFGVFPLFVLMLACSAASLFFAWTAPSRFHAEVERLGVGAAAPVAPPVE